MIESTQQAGDVGRQLVEIQRHIDLLQLEQSRLAAEFAATEQWGDDGFNTPLDWIRLNCGLTDKVAGDRLTVGRQMAGLAQSVEAMQAGEIAFAHLAVIARTAAAVGKAVDEYSLLCMARSMSPGKLYYQAQHYRHSVQPQVYADEQKEMAENNRLWLSTGQDGSLLVNGVFDPVGGAALRSALEPLTLPHLWGSPGRSPGMGPTTNSASAPPALRGTSP